MNYKDLPYTCEGFPEKHDQVYTESPITLKHVQFELSLIEQYHSQEDIVSWCDAACGTGWHLRNSNVKKPRIGVDREQNMLDFAKLKSPLGPNWVLEDVRNIPKNIGTFDLVTHLWYGYVHQKTLDDVSNFFKSLILTTSENGFLFVGVCDPVTWSSKVQHKNSIIYDNTLDCDAIIWSYKEPITDTYYKNCIAPHPILLKDWLVPYFKEIELVHYPISRGAKEWKRYGYLCKNRNHKDVQI